MSSRRPTAASARSASTRHAIPKSIREHAKRVGMPGDQIFPVADTVVVRADPEKKKDAA